MKHMKIYEPRLKLALVFVVLLLPVLVVRECVGQQVTVTKTDSTTVSGRVGAHSTTAIYVSGKMIGHKEIARVTIEENTSAGLDLAKYLQRYNIPSNIQEGARVVEVYKPIVKVELTPIELKLNKFARQRDIGKGLQAVGVVVGILGPILATDNPDAMRGFGIGGAALSLIGFGIDIDASKHLKTKQ